jgi:hypothetical protein
MNYKNLDDLLKDLEGKQLEVKDGSWLNILLAMTFGKKIKSKDKKTVFSIYNGELYLLKIDFWNLTE